MKRSPVRGSIQASKNLSTARTPEDHPDRPPDPIITDRHPFLFLDEKTWAIKIPNQVPRCQPLLGAVSPGIAGALPPGIVGASKPGIIGASAPGIIGSTPSGFTGAAPAMTHLTLPAITRASYRVARSKSSGIFVASPSRVVGVSLPEPKTDTDREITKVHTVTMAAGHLRSHAATVSAESA